MILPLLTFFLVGLLILGLMVAERYPIHTWKDRLRQLLALAQEKQDSVRVRPQEARLEDLLTSGEGDAYLGTESIAGLVDAVERTMDSVETHAASWRREVSERVGSGTREADK